MYGSYDIGGIEFSTQLFVLLRNNLCTSQKKSSLYILTTKSSTKPLTPMWEFHK